MKIAIDTATKNDHPIWYDSVSWEEPNANVITALVSSVAERIKKATKFENSEITFSLSPKKYEEINENVRLELFFFPITCIFKLSKPSAFNNFPKTHHQMFFFLLKLKNNNYTLKVFQLRVFEHGSLVFFLSCNIRRVTVWRVSGQRNQPHRNRSVNTGKHRGRLK